MGLMTDTLLIILFDRWLGIYKLYPKFEWYHAISFSKTENLRSHSLEMSSFEEEMPVLCEENEMNDQQPDNLQYEAVKDVVINEAIQKVNIFGSVLHSVHSRMADFFKKTLKNKKIVVDMDVEAT